MSGVRALDLNAGHIGRKARVREGNATFVGKITEFRVRNDSVKVTVQLTNDLRSSISVHNIVELL